MPSTFAMGGTPSSYSRKAACASPWVSVTTTLAGDGKAAGYSEAVGDGKAAGDGKVVGEGETARDGEAGDSEVAGDGEAAFWKDVAALTQEDLQ